MFSFHILSTFIIGSLFFFSSDIIYAANPQTLRNAYQIESNGQTKSYHLNDYGKKMVKKMLGQYEKQIAQKGPDIIPLLITATQDKLQRAQKTNSLGNMIIYTAVLYDLSQQNTSKGNDTTKEAKITSTGSQPKKEVTNTVKSDQKEIDEYISLVKILNAKAESIRQNIANENMRGNTLSKAQQELLIQSIGGCSKAYDLYSSAQSMEILESRINKSGSMMAESAIARAFIGEDPDHIQSKVDFIGRVSGLLLEGNSQVCTFGKNINFLVANLAKLLRDDRAVGAITLKIKELSDSKMANMEIYDFLKQIGESEKIWQEMQIYIPKDQTPTNDKRDFTLNCIINQSLIGSSEFISWQKEYFTGDKWKDIDMKRANEIFEQGMKKVCGNASYYQEIQNAVDEVTKGKIKEEHTRDRFLLANRIYEINQKTFGKSWGTAWKYFDRDTMEEFLSGHPSDEDVKDFEKMRLEYQIAKILIRAKFLKPDINIQGKGAQVDQIITKPVNNPTTSTTTDSSKISLAKEAIEFDRKNDINRIQGKETDEVLRGIDARRNIIWGREGKDALYGGKMDDIIIVVGDMRSYSNKDTVQSLELLGVPLSDLIGRNFNINGSPKIIDGGSGRDLLFVVGDVDISQTDMKGIEDIKIY